MHGYLCRHSMVMMILFFSSCKYLRVVSVPCTIPSPRLQKKRTHVSYSPVGAYSYTYLSIEHG